MSDVRAYGRSGPIAGPGAAVGAFASQIVSNTGISGVNGGFGANTVVGVAPVIQFHSNS